MTDAPRDPVDALRTGALMGLPLSEWAARLRWARVTLSGRVADLTLTLGGQPIVVEAGPIGIDAAFTGGHAPCLRRAEVRGAIALGGRSGGVLVLEGGGIVLDGDTLPLAAERVGAGRMLASLVRCVADARVQAEADPDGDVVVQLGGGIEVALAEGVGLTLRAATLGPPDALQLCAPVELGFGGDGMRLSHDGLRFLSRLASVKIERAMLHPDGSVDLQGSGRPGLDRAVRGGLHTASASLSTLVRRSPRFRRVRDLLTRDH